MHFLCVGECQLQLLSLIINVEAQTELTALKILRRQNHCHHELHFSPSKLYATIDGMPWLMPSRHLNYPICQSAKAILHCHRGQLTIQRRLGPLAQHPIYCPHLLPRPPTVHWQHEQSLLCQLHHVQQYPSLTSFIICISTLLLLKKSQNAIAKICNALPTNLAGGGGVSYLIRGHPSKP